MGDFMSLALFNSLQYNLFYNSVLKVNYITLFVYSQSPEIKVSVEIVFIVNLIGILSLFQLLTIEGIKILRPM